MQLTNLQKKTAKKSSGSTLIILAIYLYGLLQGAVSLHTFLRETNNCSSFTIKFNIIRGISCFSHF